MDQTDAINVKGHKDGVGSTCRLHVTLSAGTKCPIALIDCSYAKSNSVKHWNATMTPKVQPEPEGFFTQKNPCTPPKKSEKSEKIQKIPRTFLKI